MRTKRFVAMLTAFLLIMVCVMQANAGIGIKQNVITLKNGLTKVDQGDGIKPLDGSGIFPPQAAQITGLDRLGNIPLSISTPIIIINNGIDQNRFPELRGRVDFGNSRDFTGLNWSNLNQNDPEGSVVAAQVTSLTTTKLIDFRVFDGQNNGTMNGINSAIQECVNLAHRWHRKVVVLIAFDLPFPIPNDPDVCFVQGAGLVQNNITGRAEGNGLTMGGLDGNNNFIPQTGYGSNVVFSLGANICQLGFQANGGNYAAAYGAILAAWLCDRGWDCNRIGDCIRKTTDGCNTSFSNHGRMNPWNATQCSATVPVPFSVSASASTNVANQGDTVTFTASANLPISSASWSFSDGGSRSGAVTTYQCNTVGSLTAKVIAYDGNGHQASASVTISVNSVQQHLSPIVSLSPSSGTFKVNENITFTVSAVAQGGSSLTRVTLDFTNGIVEWPATNIVHSFPSPGTYVVRLTATDNYGLSATAVSSIVVIPQSGGGTGGLDTVTVKRAKYWPATLNAASKLKVIVRNIRADATLHVYASHDGVTRDAFVGQMDRDLNCPPTVLRWMLQQYGLVSPGEFVIVVSVIGGVEQSEGSTRIQIIPTTN